MAFCFSSDGCCFFVYLKLINNPAHVFLYSFVVLITTTIKLVYGYLVFSKAEKIMDGYPIVTWVHISVLICAVSVSAVFLVKFYKIWKGLQNNTIDDITEKINQKNKNSKWKWIAIMLGSCSPMFFVRLLDDGMQNMGLGVGFGFWILACCWLFITCLFAPKFIVSMKYNAFKWFENNETE